MTSETTPSLNAFAQRHLGPRAQDIQEMLETLGYDSLDALSDDIIPESIRLEGPLELDDARDEAELLDELRGVAACNRVYRSFIGLGYHGTVTPPVLRRNILENPGWYTQYTPYQAEISQGRLEALLNFQTMLMDLTGLEIANASLLDEATAAAEAMGMLFSETRGRERNVFLVSERCHPQTVELVRTRALPLGIELRVGPEEAFRFDEKVFGALVQYPDTDGRLTDPRELCREAHEAGAKVIMAADLMALALVTPPGELGADIAVGNTQRFGVPMGYGGPHAAYMAATETFKRKMPGRIIGVSRDADDRPALRMALQTREQHIRREKATSNICTAQVLLAIMAGMYAVYHGPEGIREIASRIHHHTRALATGLREAGHELLNDTFFDTARVRPGGGASAQEILRRAREREINLRDFQDGTLGVALDETAGADDVRDLLEAFGSAGQQDALQVAENVASMSEDALAVGIPGELTRESSYLDHEVFQSHRSETEMLRYLNHLQERDLSLAHSMIPLGSCTMKLNATAQMEPISWPEFANLHPYAPAEQAQGYRRIIHDLERWLGEITGLSQVSLQPNSGAQGEYAGLLTIRAYHDDRGDDHRDVCLIPSSAHGTNPASAVMAGMKVVVVKCDDWGNVDLEDLEAKCREHAERLGALMVTYPSTHGVFEPHIREVCDLVHQHGGQVYLDGANLNAQVGLTRPGDYGADVCHVNLHKTFAIPHGGGGPGMGPICAADHLGPYLPGHPLAEVGGEKAIGPVAAAPWGSPSILVISWAYMALLGAEGQKQASQVALLNANYMAKRLEGQFDVLFRGSGGQVAHEFILDLSPFRKEAGITEEDIAKRLIDYGFHAPTMSWPVPATVMVEPTESESRDELDRFCDALISIRAEIQQVEMGIADKKDNLLKNAPHTADMVVSDDWERPYAREKAAFPAPWTRARKFWPVVRRVDNAHGDRHLVCACPPLEAYEEGGSRQESEEGAEKRT